MADKPAFKLTDFDRMFKKSDKTEEKQPETVDSATGAKKQKAPKLPLSSLRKFRNHPFKAYTGDKLNELVESIKEHGILTPILVRPLDSKPDAYEIIAGHKSMTEAEIRDILVEALLFFKKRPHMVDVSNERWIESAENEDGIPLNQYFMANRRWPSLC